MTLIFGLGTFLMWNELRESYPEWGIWVAALIFLGYAWASYSRSTGHEKSKRVCLYISSAVVILRALAGQFGVDFVLWFSLMLLDIKLRQSIIK